MKCPKCGSFISPSDRQCGTCGFQVDSDPAGEARTPDQAEWRKQVTQKVKAYGERKRILTTPPKPIKEGETTPPEMELTTPAPAPPEPDSGNPVTDEPGPLSGVDPSPAAADVLQGEKHAPANDRYLLPPPDLDASDLIDIDLDDDLQSVPFPVLPPPRYLYRRMWAVILDHTVLVVLMIVLLYGAELVTAFTMRELWTDFSLPLVCAFLLFHLLYYVYFYKTSRQTPGQLFLRLELKDPLSGSVPLRRVLLRWLAFVVLNVFNLVPVLTGDDPLLLDRISGTEIRMLTHE